MWLFSGKNCVLLESGAGFNWPHQFSWVTRRAKLNLHRKRAPHTNRFDNCSTTTWLSSEKECAFNLCKMPPHCHAITVKFRNVIFSVKTSKFVRWQTVLSWSFEHKMKLRLLLPTKPSLQKHLSASCNCKISKTDIGRKKLLFSLTRDNRRLDVKMMSKFHVTFWNCGSRIQSKTLPGKRRERLRARGTWCKQCQCQMVAVPDGGCNQFP